MLTLSITTTVTGTVATSESVVLDGIFTGTLNAGERIIVTGRAVVSGELVADEITIDGTVNADVYARKVVLGDTATVRGRLFHGDLVLGPHTYFEGQSRRHADPRALWLSRVTA